MSSKTRNKLIEMKRQLTPQDLTDIELKKQFTKKPADVKKCKGRIARLKGMQTQWEPYKQQIEKYTEKKKKDSNNLPEKIDRLKQIIKEECAHPIEYIEVIEDHIPGNQDTYSCTKYYVKCNVCGTKKLAKTKEHSSYV